MNRNFTALIKSDFDIPLDLQPKFWDFGLTFRNMILEAKNRIYIASYVAHSRFPWFEELKLIYNKKPNLDLRILIDKEATLDIEIKKLPIKNIRKFTRGRLHMKAIVVDSCKCIVGSANLTYSASERNYELGVYLEGQECTYVEELFLYLWNISKL